MVDDAHVVSKLIVVVDGCCCFLNVAGDSSGENIGDSLSMFPDSIRPEAQKVKT